MGSDLDLVAVVAQSGVSFHRRTNLWDLTGLPLPAELLVYTEEEWATLPERSWFGRTLHEETVWSVRAKARVADRHTLQ